MKTNVDSDEWFASILDEVRCEHYDGNKHVVLSISVLHTQGQIYFSGGLLSGFMNQPTFIAWVELDRPILKTTGRMNLEKKKHLAINTFRST